MIHRLLAATLLMAVLTPASARAQVPEGWVGNWAGATRNPPPGVPAPELPYDELEKAILTHLQPWAREKYEATEWNADDTGQVCKPDGIFRAGHEGSGGFRFVAAPGKLYQLWSPDEHGLHRIYLNTPHPVNVTPTWNGDARGHWEGDTLVVDITGFNDKSWLGSDRQPHTEELHVIERYRLFNSGAYMELRVFVDDRKAFTSPYTYTRYYKKMLDGSESPESVCNQAEPGEDLWQQRQTGVLEKHETAFAAFMKPFIDRPLPATSAAAQPLTPKVTIPPAVAMPLSRFAGIYGLVPAASTVLGDLKPMGTLSDLPLLPAVATAAKSVDLTTDPAKNCQAIGPFRMMAHAGTRMELLAGSDRLTMVFEETALGNRREVYLWPRPAKVEPSWLGDSRGSWDGDTFVVDTVGLNDRTWLDDRGAAHSRELHVVERYRLLRGGQLLEINVTATDPGSLQKPYTYRRYYARQDSELQQQFCRSDSELFAR